MDKKKLANNILEFLLDPTQFPVEQRLYFRPEERLDNKSFDAAKQEALKAYGDQRHNMNMYPTQNRETKAREVSMDRRALVASMDILAQNFKDEDPISEHLKLMAKAVSEMGDDELSARTAENAPEDFSELEKTAASDYTKFVKKWLKSNPGKGIGDAAKAWKKEKKADDAGDHVAPPVEEEAEKPAEEEAKKPVEEEKPIEASVEVNDFWTKEASDAVARAIVADVKGIEFTAAHAEPESLQEEAEETSKEQAKEEAKKKAVEIGAPMLGPKTQLRPSPSGGGGAVKGDPKRLQKYLNDFIEEGTLKNQIMKMLGLKLAAEEQAPVEEEKKVPVEEEKPADKPKESKVVDTSMLTAEKKDPEEEKPEEKNPVLSFDGIELTNPMQTAEEAVFSAEDTRALGSLYDAIEMTADEKDKLNSLFR